MGLPPRKLGIGVQPECLYILLCGYTVCTRQLGCSGNVVQVVHPLFRILKYEILWIMALLLILRGTYCFAAALLHFQADLVLGRSGHSCLSPGLPGGCATGCPGRHDCPEHPWHHISLEIEWQCSGIVSVTHRGKGFSQTLDLPHELEFGEPWSKEIISQTLFHAQNY